MLSKDSPLGEVGPSPSFPHEWGLDLAYKEKDRKGGKLTLQWRNLTNTASTMWPKFT